MTKDYGIRPELYDSYGEMTSTITKKEMFDLQPEPDSEFEKPYLTDDYPEMQNFHALNYDVPFLTSEFEGIDIAGPGTKKKRVTGHAELHLVAYPDEIRLGESSHLVMGGFDYKGKPWKDITWNILHFGGGGLKPNKDSIPASAEYSPTLEDIPCTDILYGGTTTTIAGYDSEGSMSAAIVKVTVPFNLEIVGAEIACIGSLYAIRELENIPGISWSISQGSMDARGIITSSASDTANCDSGYETITASSGCGVLATKSVQLPGFYWELVGETQYCDYGSSCTKVVITGDVQLIYYTSFVTVVTSTNCNPGGGHPPCPEVGGDLHLECPTTSIDACEAECGIECYEAHPTNPGCYPVCEGHSYTTYSRQILWKIETYQKRCLC